MEDASIEQNKREFKGLLLGCPLGQAADDCPAGEFRAMSTGRQQITIQTMDPQQIEDIIVHHHRCMKQRQGE
ncbi:MAG: hypothetical protein HN350_11105 [Phycisphaerales bacterium]|jgi:hypothetical protein|nr:hypothetical protein [Phycisphaerales bacterium]